MNCYQCGSPSLPDQKFCRSCGTSLQVITKPLAEIPELETPPKITRQWARNLLPVGFVTMFLGLFIAVTGGVIIQEKIITNIGILVFIFGMFLIGLTDLLRRTRPKPVSNPQPETLTPSQPITYLSQERTIEYLPGVTERTTSLLPHPAATNPRQQESGELQS